MPKSISLMSPSFRIITFSGLTSRWMTPSECAWASARQTSTAISAATSENPSGAPVQELLERLPVDELGDDVRARRPEPRVVEDLQDVLVAQLGHRLRLAFEARLRLGLAGQVLVEDLDRHLALQGLVLRAIHDRHATLAHLFDELIPFGNAGLLHPSP